MPFVEQFETQVIDSLGLTLVHRAAALGRANFLSALKQAGFELITHNNKDGMTTLHYAAQAVDSGADVLLHLLADKALRRIALESLSSRVPSNGHTVAMEAVFNGNENLVQLLIQLRAQGEDIDSTTVMGWSPKAFARREKMPFWEELPDSRIVPLVDLPSSDDWLARQNVVRTAWVKTQEDEWLNALPAAERTLQSAGVRLLAAVVAADFETTATLLKPGQLDVNGHYGRLGATALNSVSGPGMTAVDIAKARGMIAYLLSRGADPLNSETGVMRVSAGFREAVFGYSLTLSDLIERFESDSARKTTFLNVQGPLNGYTKLIDAALRGRAEAMTTLLDAGADTSLFGHNGMTARAAALKFNALHPNDGLALPASLIEQL